MNTYAGTRSGPCRKDICPCSEYLRREGPGSQPCECSHPRRFHAQSWSERPLVTPAGWNPEAA